MVFQSSVYNIKKTITAMIVLMLLSYSHSSLSKTKNIQNNSVSFLKPEYSELQLLLENNICFQLNSFSELMSKHNFIPNSWNGSNAEIVIQKGGDWMVQPRMIQFALNLMIIDYKSPNFFDSLPCDVSIYKILEDYVIKITNNYEILVPWKHNHDFSNKIDEPMSTYDLGDWMVIISILARKKESEKISQYLQNLAYFSIDVFNRHSDGLDYPDMFDYGYNSRRSQNAEIGHITLFLDGLIHAYISNKDQNIIDFVKAKLDQILASRDKPMVEIFIEEENNFSSMMTYGEFLETTLFLHYVTGEDKYLDISYELAKEVKEFFYETTNDKVVLKFNNSNNNEICGEAMSLEASSYNLLKLSAIMEDPDLEKSVLSHVNSYYLYGTINGMPVSKYCVNESNNNSNLQIGHYYGLMKTLWFIERNNLKLEDVEAIDWLTQLIKSLEGHKLKYGFVNSLSDLDNIIVNDPGGNVWVLNEGLIPIYYSLMNSDKFFNTEFNKQSEYFAGCNFILVDKAKVNPVKLFFINLSFKVKHLF